MFDRLVLAFYSVDPIENWGVFLSYDWELKSNMCVFFFLQFVLWRYQVIIMIRKHDAISRSQLYLTIKL